MAKRKSLPNQYVVNELVLVDQSGRSRAVLSTDPQTGCPMLAFLDSKEQQRLVVGLQGKDLPFLSLGYEDGRAAAGCGMDDRGGAGFTLSDRSGSPAIVLMVHSDGTRSMQIYDENLKLVWSA